MSTNKALSPYFENGVFAGVRVTLEGEDFVITPKDYSEGNKKTMPWNYAMFVLEEKGLETFNRKQACLIAEYREEIDEILIQNGGDPFEHDSHYWTCDEVQYNWAYDYYTPGTVDISVNALSYRVRLIKTIKK